MDDILQIKREHITEPIKRSIKIYGNKPHTDNTSAIENMNEFYLSYKESQNAYAEYQQEVDDWKKSNDNAETPIQPILL